MKHSKYRNIKKTLQGYSELEVFFIDPSDLIF